MIEQGYDGDDEDEDSDDATLDEPGLQNVDNQGLLRVDSGAFKRGQLNRLITTFPKERVNWDFDVSKGFTMFYNGLLDKLAHSKFTSAEYAIVLALIRKTLGYHKHVDFIALTQFMAITGLDKRTVQKSLKRLRERKVVIKLAEPGRAGTCWELNRRTREWPDRTPRKLRNTEATLSGGKIAAVKGGNDVAPGAAKVYPTIDTETKYRIKIKKETFQPTATTHKLRFRLRRGEA